MARTRITYFVILNELNLAWAAILLARGRDVCVLAVHPYFRQTRSCLEGLVRRWIDRGRASDASKRFPSVGLVFRMPNFSCLTDINLKIEPWLDKFYRFADVDHWNSDYSRPVKQSVWLSVERFSNIVLAIDALRRDGVWETAQFVGLNRDIVGMYEAYRGVRPPGFWLRTPFPRWAFNLLQAVSLMMYVPIEAARHTRLRAPLRDDFLLGSTYAADPRLFKNLSDISDRRDQVCVVFPNADARRRATERFDLSGFATCTITDGRLSPGRSLLAMAATVADIVRLTSKFADYRAVLFFQVIKLAVHRFRYRALFSTYRFRFFWGRDDHDPVHQIRSQELRRVDGVSLGINHGIPVSNLLEPGWRYIDFDIYYVFGRHLYERYYADTWPRHMKVNAIGSFGMSRNELREVKVSRTKDIVVFANPTLNNPLIVRTAQELALAFPDRTVFFKSKPPPKDSFFTDLFDELQPFPENLVFLNAGLEVTYDLLKWCGYAIATISTVGAEAIFFGAKTFILDTQPRHYPLYYRDFPGLCFREPEHVIERIRRLEAGTTRYRWEDFAGLVDLSNRDPYDTIRADMGLAPKGPDTVVEPLRRLRQAR